MIKTEYRTHAYDYKRRNEMEQRLIHWARSNMQGWKTFRIGEAHDRILAVQKQLEKDGVRGRVTVSEPKVTGTWVGGSVACKTVFIHAPGRSIPSVLIEESYKPNQVLV